MADLFHPILNDRLSRRCVTDGKRPIFLCIALTFYYLQTYSSIFPELEDFGDVTPTLRAHNDLKCQRHATKVTFKIGHDSLFLTNIVGRFKCAAFKM